MTPIELARQIQPETEAQVQGLAHLEAGEYDALKLLALTHPGDHYLKALGYLAGAARRPDAAPTIYQEAIAALGQEVGARWTMATCKKAAHQLRFESQHT